VCTVSIRTAKLHGIPHFPDDCIYVIFVHCRFVRWSLKGAYSLGEYNSTVGTTVLHVLLLLPVRCYFLGIRLLPNNLVYCTVRTTRRTADFIFYSTDAYSTLWSVVTLGQLGQHKWQRVHSLSNRRTVSYSAVLQKLQKLCFLLLLLLVRCCDFFCFIIRVQYCTGWHPSCSLIFCIEQCQARWWNVERTRTSVPYRTIFRIYLVTLFFSHKSTNVSRGTRTWTERTLRSSLM